MFCCRSFNNYPLQASLLGLPNLLQTLLLPMPSFCPCRSLCLKQFLPRLSPVVQVVAQSPSTCLGFRFPIYITRRATCNLRIAP